MLHDQDGAGLRLQQHLEDLYSERFHEEFKKKDAIDQNLNYVLSALGFLGGASGYLMAHSLPLQAVWTGEPVEIALGLSLIFSLVSLALSGMHLGFASFGWDYADFEKLSDFSDAWRGIENQERGRYQDRRSVEIVVEARIRRRIMEIYLRATRRNFDINIQRLVHRRKSYWWLFTGFLLFILAVILFSAAGKGAAKADEQGVTPNVTRSLNQLSDPELPDPDPDPDDPEPIRLPPYPWKSPPALRGQAGDPQQTAEEEPAAEIAAEADANADAE